MSFEELGLHGGCSVDANQPGLPWAQVGKAVRNPGRPENDVAGAALDGFVADPDQDMALENDEGFVVGVLVQLGSLTDVVVHEEKRH